MTKEKGVSEYAALGGKARAQRLTPEQRSESARHAAATRWGTEPVPIATHVGEIKLGNTTIPCAVLEDGTRVLTQQGFLQAIGRSGRPTAGKGSSVEKMAPFLALDNLKPYIDSDLERSSRPILFRGPGAPKGAYAFGYRAELLPRVCEVYLRARDEGKLTTVQERFAVACELIVRGLAHVGITALIDEATGFQDARARDALAKILEAFVTRELRRWVSTFPADYYKELFRLRGWHFPTLPKDQQKRPVMVGKITNDVVYARLAPGVRQELHRLTPRDEKGRLKHKLFQHLTEDMGHPKLKEHLASIVALMRAADDWEGFERMLNRALPKYADLPLLEAMNAEAGA